MPRKVFAPGDVLAAADVNTFLMNQAVMTFADSSARTAAIATATEGMVSYLNDTNVISVWNGSAWIAVNSPDTTTIAANATVSSSQANGLLYSTASTGITVTIPDVLNIGDRVDVFRDGAGTVSLVCGSGVTGWAGIGTAQTSFGTAGTAVAFKIDQQYNAATVLKVAANSYRVVGKISV